MERLVYAGTNMTPHIIFDKSEAVFSMIGTSRPENPYEYYKPIFSWLNTYFENPNDTTSFHVELDYFNTSTSKILLDIFEIFEKNTLKGIHIHVNWFYQSDDDEMMEAGEELLNLVDISFEVKEVEI